MLRKNVKILNTFALKVIALISMIIDHIGIGLIEHNTTVYYAFRIVGRLAFPLFAFLLVQGFMHTSNLAKYKLRLSICAIISEPLYDIMKHGKLIYLWDQNTLFSLLLGLILLDVMSKNKEFLYNFIYMIIFCGIAEIFRLDYAAAGIIMIYGFYTFRNYIWIEMSILAIANIFFLDGMIQKAAIVAIIPILMYNNECGPKKYKNFFYVVYPIHMAIICALHYYL